MISVGENTDQELSVLQPYWGRLRVRNSVVFAVFRKIWFLRYDEIHGKLEPLFCLGIAGFTLRLYVRCT